MHKIRVGVLRGGPSDEYEVSLKSGATVLKNLKEDRYISKDIFISKDGKWHHNGMEKTPHELLSNIDVVFNALHGKYGEDGKIQHMFEMYNIPHTGSGSFASILGMNKVLSKEVFEKHGIRTPSYVVFESIDDVVEESLRTVLNKFPPPFIVKPATSGSSVGVSIVKNLSELDSAIKLAFKYSDMVIVEEFVKGVEATVGIIDWYRDEFLYALPPVEIRHKKDFFDYDAKYSGENSGTEEIVPGNFDFRIKKDLEEIARKVHTSLGLEHYSRTDFIVSPSRGIFVLETNTLPGLTEESLFPKALSSVGSSLPHFFDHIITLALKRGKY